MLKTSARHLTPAALTIAAMTSLPAIDAKAQDGYSYGDHYHRSGQQNYGQYSGRK